MSADAETDPILDAHRRRWRQLDPWLPTAAPLPEASGQDTVLACANGKGVARSYRVDLDSFEASWSAARTYELLARVGGSTAMDTLLTQWQDHVAGLAAPGERDAWAMLTWPSRDTQMTPVFVAHGLTPLSVLAARPARRPSPSPEADVRLRELAPARIGAAAAMWAAVIGWDEPFGTMAVRESTGASIRRELTQALRSHHPWIWLAEDQGEPVGLIVVSPPERAAWAAQMVATSPAAYLTCLGVTPSHRGHGVGAALVQTAHAALDRTPARVTLLHYAALSPLSGPFWHRCGYRPLWTTWARRPDEQRPAPHPPQPDHRTQADPSDRRAQPDPGPLPRHPYDVKPHPGIA